MTAAAVLRHLVDPSPAVPAVTNRAPCRFCGASLAHTVVDLGKSPLCESYLAADALNTMEPFYPLHVFVCTRCYLVQLESYVDREAIFGHYAYFSSYSDSWLDHARRYTEAMIDRFTLDARSQVIEVASNDGYLLQYFVKRGIPALGIEPAANVAAVAEQKGVRSLVRFFGEALGRELAASGTRADLMLGNNVLAQVDDVNDFVAGFKPVLAPRGVLTLEFPHLMRMIEGRQFDTIYHEHFSYFSLYSAERILGAHGLRIFDVEELATHGGSLRIFAGHAEDATKTETPRLIELRAREVAAGVATPEYYVGFRTDVWETKRALLDLLIEVKRAGKRVVGYGAPGKGNTLLNYCGIRTDFVDFTVDRSPFKQGKFLPGTHIPILEPAALDRARPDYVLILPWNLTDEIVKQLAHIRSWGGRFIVPIPTAQVLG